jgi:hypothetical protein
MLKLLLLKIVLIAAFPVLYRLGGSENGTRMARISGIPLLTFFYLWFTSGPHWTAFLTCGLMAGALSSYWNRKNADETWINFYLHGMGIALAFVPQAWHSGHWAVFFERLAILPLSIAFWATKMNKPFWKWRADVVNEGGRGLLTAMGV